MGLKHCHLGWSHINVQVTAKIKETPAQSGAGPPQARIVSMHLGIDSTTVWNSIGGMQHYTSKINSIIWCFVDGGGKTYQAPLQNLPKEFNWVEIW